jgi:hypothetical protein
VLYGMTDKLLVTFSAISTYWKQKEYSETVHQLFIDLRNCLIQLGMKYCTVFSYSLEYP